MSPKTTAGKNVNVSSNLYTAILALTCAIVAATAGLVAYKCYFDYETLFKIVKVFH